VIRFAWLMAAVLLAGVAIRADARPDVAAHRAQTGAGLPENSLAAIADAMARGVAILEIDLRTTADGIIVLHHDRVGSRTLADLKRASGDKIGTLDAALALVRGGRVRLLLDVKQGGGVRPETLVALLDRHRLRHRVIFGVSTDAEARAYRALAPPNVVLGFIDRPADADRFAAAGADAVRLWPKWIFARGSGCAAGAAPTCLVQRLKQRGLAVWTTEDGDRDRCRTIARFAQFETLGLDGVITDRPELAAVPPDPACTTR
jgi:glycerophosphoryl diester phosphodiesterase